MSLHKSFSFHFRLRHIFLCSLLTQASGLTFSNQIANIDHLMSVEHQDTSWSRAIECMKELVLVNTIQITSREFWDVEIHSTCVHRFREPFEVTTLWSKFGLRARV